MEITLKNVWDAERATNRTYYNTMFKNHSKALASRKPYTRNMIPHDSHYFRHVMIQPLFAFDWIKEPITDADVNWSSNPRDIYYWRWTWLRICQYNVDAIFPPKSHAKSYQLLLSIFIRFSGKWEIHFHAGAQAKPLCARLPACPAYYCLFIPSFRRPADILQNHFPYLQHNLRYICIQRKIRIMRWPRPRLTSSRSVNIPVNYFRNNVMQIDSIAFTHFTLDHFHNIISLPFSFCDVFETWI